MLNNLKLGSTTNTLTLTPQDTNIATNFTLPQLYSGDADTYSSNDDPYAYGPVPGDTGTGATNYGYLYNWSAATAGESTTSHTQNDGDAPYSICPANWRLPKSGVIDTDTMIPSPTNEFNTLSAMMAGFPNGQDPTYLSNLWEYQSNWLANGPFKGSLAGVWYEGFDGQGGGGYLWSSSAFPVYADGAFFAYFYSDYVSPSGYVYRGYGIGVRCLLNQ